ncbi:mannose-6-phosphate isomerase, class I [bacterium J17]|nr:mannose-6-phosphate isomerase, class I [bacterium J17]
MEFDRPLKLIPAIKHYDWGSLESSSLVARLSNSTIVEKPLAELWLGAHPKSSSLVEQGGEKVPLVDCLSESSTTILGQAVIDSFGPRLPFLFKALSINRALSIQAHPDKDLAALLHRKSPKSYPDDNHKPEIAIAATEVEMLYGFRTSQDIVRQLKRVKELEYLLGVSEIQDFINAEQSGSADRLLKSLFIKLMNASDGAVKRASESLSARLAEQAVLNKDDRCAAKLLEQHPSGDRGVFCVYLLNLLTIRAGEAIFSEPNTPHAYISGDLFECMANSDNVVRAGLTSKFVDVKTLAEMLSYEQGPPRLVASEVAGGGGRVFPTAAKEFEVLKYSRTSTDIQTNEAVELVFCVSGRTNLVNNDLRFELSAGDSYLIPAAAGSYSLEIDSAEVFRVKIP